MRNHNVFFVLLCMLFCVSLGGSAWAQHYAEVFLEGTDLQPDASGVATLSRVDCGYSGCNTEILIDLEGVSTGRHAWHIHNGSCESQGPMVTDLSQLAGDLEADGDGIVAGYGYIAGTVPTQSRYLDVHEYSSQEGSGGVITCGNVQQPAP